jgi:hypothetical protein
LQPEEQQHGGGGMEQDAGQMMPAGMQAVELAIQQVGKPRHRMPVGAEAVGEHPGDGGPMQSAGNERIFVHVLIIVVVDEVEMQCLAEDHPDDRGQEDQGKNLLFHAAHLIVIARVEFSSPAMVVKEIRSG